MSHVEPKAVPLPRESRIAAVYDRPNLMDAYSIDLPPGTARDPVLLARFILAHQPRWVTVLMGVRDSAVSLVGLKTGRSLRAPGEPRERIGIFRIFETHPFEVLVGEDDRHLDFRTSILYREPGPDGSASVVLSTVVHCHNLLGHCYLTLIAPFHRRVVQSFLRQAASLGWPLEPPSAPSDMPGIVA